MYRWSLLSKADRICCGGKTKKSFINTSLALFVITNRKSYELTAFAIMFTFSLVSNEILHYLIWCGTSKQIRHGSSMIKDGWKGSSIGKRALVPFLILIHISLLRSFGLFFWLLLETFDSYGVVRIKRWQHLVVWRLPRRGIISSRLRRQRHSSFAPTLKNVPSEGYLNCRKEFKLPRRSFTASYPTRRIHTTKKGNSFPLRREWIPFFS